MYDNHSNESPSKSSSEKSCKESPMTPDVDSKATPHGDSPDSGSSESPSIVGGVKPDKRKYRRTLGDDGKPKKNFYNPPSKVIRHLAQNSYYENFYGNQFYTLKQKYKTQMCKHYLNTGECPLKQYCQFAHGP